MKPSKFAWSEKSPDGKLFVSIWNSTPLSYVMLRLTCGVIRDGKHIQSFAKFQLNMYIHIQIDVFLCVAVLTAKGPFYRTKIAS